jgi:hypothetical protein
MRSLVPALLGAAALLAGCTQPQSSSTGDFKGDEKDVAQVVADLADDAARNKQSHVCGEILSARLEKAVAGDSSCPNEVKKAFEDADANTLDVDDVTVTGEKATAKVSTKNGDATVSRTFRFVKADGSWRIDSFG